MLHKWTNPLTFNAALIGAIATITMVQPQIVLSLTPEEINQQVKGFTVKIDGVEKGSGVIVAQSGNQYTVLTNWHVVDSDGNYTIETSDGITYQSSKIEQIQGVDLALIYFNSSQSYPVARKGNSDKLIEGDTIHYGGYPASQGRVYRFFGSQSITGFVEKADVKNGYEIIFNGTAIGGMSGSPLIDDNGNLIGIYGKTEVNFPGGFSLYGIPINKVTNVAWNQVCSNVNGQVVNKNEKQALVFQISELVNKGDQQFRQSQYPAALNQYRKATEIAQKNNLDCHDPWYYQGITLLKLKQPNEAIASFDNALKSDPNNYTTWCKKGNVLAYLGELEEAKKSYRQATIIIPNASGRSKDCKILSERFSGN